MYENVWNITLHDISRKRPTVKTQQEDEDVIRLDIPGKSSSETVKDIQPTSMSAHPFPPPFPRKGGADYARLIYCIRKLCWLSLLAEILILLVLAT